MKEAVDSFLYSLPDLGLAGFGAPAAGSRHDHFRGNEIKELACAGSRIHFAQPAARNLLIKIMNERAMHSSPAVRFQGLHQFGKTFPLHSHNAMKGNRIHRENAIQEQFPKRSQSLFRPLMGEEDG